MDPTSLADIQFKQARHGYEPAEVDAYVDTVSTTVSQLQAQIRELRHRLHDAETRATENGQAEETLRRTLVLAQRTADAAIAEARADAEAISADARARADQLMRDAEYDADKRVREAESQATMLRAEAEKEARRVVEATRQPLLDEIRELEQVRNFLSDDIAILEEHIEVNRHRVRSSLEHLQRLLESPDGLRFAPTPALSGATMADDGAATLFEDGTAWDVTATDLWDAPVAEPVAELASTVTEEPAPVVATAAVDPVVVVDDQPEAAPDLEVDVAPSFDGIDEIHDADLVDDLVDDGPPTEAMDVIDLTDAPASTGDSFLDELRKAVGDEPPAEDPVFTAFFDGDDQSDDRRPRFGRRR